MPRQSFDVLRRSAALGLCLGTILTAAAWADAPAVVVSPVLSATQTANGQPITLPQGAAQVLVSRFEIPSGARLPVHMHPFPRMAYVLSGALVVTDVATGVETTYATGGFVVEMVNAWHFGRNAGSEPVQLLVIDFVPEGQTNTITQAP